MSLLVFVVEGAKQKYLKNYFTENRIVFFFKQILLNSTLQVFITNIYISLSKEFFNTK